MRFGKIGARRMVSMLPYDAEVEWLELNGNQFIETNLFIDSEVWTCDAYVDFSDPVKIDDYTIGCIGRPTARYGFVYMNNSQVRLAYSTNMADFKIVGSDFFGVSRLWHVSYANGSQSLTVGSYSLSASKSWVDIDEQYRRIRFSNATGTQCSIRFGTITLHRNSVLVGDFVPVRIGSVGAMYDKRGVGGMNVDGSARTDGLYFNRGTGAFIVGPDKISLMGGGA